MEAAYNRDIGLFLRMFLFIETDVFGLSMPSGQAWPEGICFGEDAPGSGSHSDSCRCQTAMYSIGVISPKELCGRKWLYS